MDCSQPSSPKTKLWAENAETGILMTALCRLFLFRLPPEPAWGFHPQTPSSLRGGFKKFKK